MSRVRFSPQPSTTRRMRLKRGEIWATLHNTTQTLRTAHLINDHASQRTGVSSRGR
jgi:hypothetical protein